MLEITKDMLDQTIEAERKNKASLDKSSQKTACRMVALVGIEFAVLFMLLLSNFWTALIFAAIILAVDFVLFFGVTVLISRKYISGFTVSTFVRAFKNHKFNQAVISADNDTKIFMYEYRLAKAKGGERLLSINALIPMYLRINENDKAEALLKESEDIVPKNFLQRSAKAVNYLTFYGAVSDGESFIRAYRENEAVIAEMWNNVLTIKIEALKYTAVFLAYNKEYEKAIEYYLNLIEFQEKAEEIDASCAINEEGKNAYNIDLAILYCKSGNTEKAVEYFREAKDFFADTDQTFIISALDKAEKTLAEAGIGLSDVSETEE